MVRAPCKKGGAPVTRPVGVLDPAPPRRGCSCDEFRGNSCNSCKSAILAEDYPSGSSHRRSPLHVVLLFLAPRWLQKSTCFSHRLGLALGRLYDGFGAQHGPNLGPFWSQVGHFLGHFWVLFWHLNLRSFWRRFLIDCAHP